MLISKIESWSGKLGVTDYIFSVGLKCYDGKQRVYNPISVRPRSLWVKPT